MSTYQEYSLFVNETKLSEQSKSISNLVYSLNEHDLSGVDISRLMCGAIGQAAETGELLEVLKSNDFSVERVINELGDVVFYVFVSAMAIGVELEPMVLLDDISERVILPGTIQHQQLINHTINLIINTSKYLDIVKKLIFQGKVLSDKLYTKLSNLLLAICMDVSELAQHLGFDVEYVIDVNMQKLNKRYSEKFTVAESERR